MSNQSSIISNKHYVCHTASIPNTKDIKARKQSRPSSMKRSVLRSSLTSKNTKFLSTP